MSRGILKWGKIFSNYLKIKQLENGMFLKMYKIQNLGVRIDSKGFIIISMYLHYLL